MDIPNMSINMPLMYNNVPNLHAPVPTEINQQSNPINPEATHADNNTSDDIKTGGVSVYV